MKKFLLGLTCGIALTAMTAVYIPDNTDFQKLFLLLLIDQIGDLKTKEIEFGSNKENALAYASGSYKKDGIEGW